MPWVLYCVALGITFTCYLVFHLPLSVSFLIPLVGWPAIGMLVTLDDDLPGGWSNPDGNRKPDILRPPFWGQIIGGIALTSAGAAIDNGWNSLGSIVFWLLAVIGFVAATPMVRSGLKPNGD